jgi:hypothetical protein
MEEDISLSRGRGERNDEKGEIKATENEKVSIRNQVRKSLRETQLKISNSQGLSKVKT